MIFKVLTYGSMLVDDSMLHQHICSTDEPRLYNVSTTIEDLIETLESLNRIFGQMNDSRLNTIVDNLKKCKLTTVMLTIQDGELIKNQINPN